MDNKKISELPAGTTLTGTEDMVVVQGGSTVKVKVPSTALSNAPAGTPSLRSLGMGATEAAAGNDPRFSTGVSGVEIGFASTNAYSSSPLSVPNATAVEVPGLAITVPDLVRPVYLMANCPSVATSAANGSVGQYIGKQVGDILGYSSIHLYATAVAGYLFTRVRLAPHTPGTYKVIATATIPGGGNGLYRTNIYSGPWIFSAISA